MIKRKFGENLGELRKAKSKDLAQILRKLGAGKKPVASHMSYFTRSTPVVWGECVCSRISRKGTSGSKPKRYNNFW